MDIERYNKILGLESHKPNTKKVCFLPWLGEFGWYIFNHVKRIQGYNHDYKIVCTKPGHECLFPTAKEFFYDWTDIPDSEKAGVNKLNKPAKTALIEKLKSIYGDDTYFVDPFETSWTEKETLAHIKFVPESINNFGLKTDVIILPRYREVYNNRNWNLTNWQSLVNKFNYEGYKVGVCGAKESTQKLSGIEHYSYNHVDVDSDVEMISKTKLVIGQDSGILYLAGLCRKPVIMVGPCFTPNITRLHLDEDVFFNNIEISAEKYKAHSDKTVDRILKTVAKFFK